MVSKVVSPFNANAYVVVAQQKYLTEPVKVERFVPVPVQEKQALVVGVSVIAEEELHQLASWLESFSASIGHHMNVKICLVMSTDMQTHLLKSQIKRMIEQSTFPVSIYYQPTYLLYKFPFVKLQTCVQNMDLKEEDLIFSSDIFALYPPSIAARFALEVECGRRVSYPIVEKRGGHDVSQFAACKADLAKALSQTAKFKRRDDNLFFIFFSKLKRNIIRSVTQIKSRRSEHIRSLQNKYKGMNLMRGQASKFGRTNSLTYKFLHHSYWKRSKLHKFERGVKLFFTGKTANLGDVYNSVSVPSNSAESIQSSIYSDNLDQIKSILLNAAFVHAEIGDEIHFIIEFDNFQDYRRKFHANKNLRLCILYGTRLDENLHIKCDVLLETSNKGWNIYTFDIKEMWKKKYGSSFESIEFLSAHVSIKSLVSRKKPEPVVPIFLLDDFGIEFQETKISDCSCLPGISYDAEHVCRQITNVAGHNRPAFQSKLEQIMSWIEGFLKKKRH